MYLTIADVLTTVVFVLLFALIVFILIKLRVKNWGKVTENENENGHRTKARAKILFKSISEYDRTNYTNLTTYHVRELYLDCLINGEKKTLLCSEYMYNFVQKGETYDVFYGNYGVELDRKYYPEGFDDYFEDLDNPDIEE